MHLLANHQPKKRGRWATNDSGYFVSRNGRQVLEVLLLKRKADSKYQLPSSFMIGEEVVPASILSLLFSALDQVPVGSTFKNMRVFVNCLCHNSFRVMMTNLK